MIIEDVNVGEEISNTTDAIYSTDEDSAAIVFRALKYFRLTGQPIHEATHYPSETEEDGTETMA